MLGKKDKKPAFAGSALEIMRLLGSGKVTAEQADQIVTLLRGKPTNLLPYEVERIQTPLAEVQDWRIGSSGDLLLMGPGGSDSLHHTVVYRKSDSQAFYAYATGALMFMDLREEVSGPVLAVKKKQIGHHELRYGSWGILSYSEIELNEMHQPVFWKHGGQSFCVVCYREKGKEGFFVDLLTPGIGTRRWCNATVVWRAHIPKHEGVIIYPFKKTAILMVKKDGKWCLQKDGKPYMTPASLDPNFFHYDDQGNTYFHIDSHVLKFDGFPKDMDHFEVMGGGVCQSHRVFRSGEHVFVFSHGKGNNRLGLCRLDGSWCASDDSPFVGNTGVFVHEVIQCTDGNVFVLTSYAQSRGTSLHDLVLLCGETGRLLHVFHIDTAIGCFGPLLGETLAYVSRSGVRRLWNDDQARFADHPVFSSAPCLIGGLVEQRDGSFMALHHIGGGQISIFRWPAELFKMKT